MRANIINGNRDNNQLFGTIGDDLIRGRNGDDFIDGGAGRDILVGGRGADTFFFEAGDGIDQSTGDVVRDIIRRYEVGVDTIQLDVDEADVTFRDTGRGTIIDYEGGSILVRGVSSADLTLEFADSGTTPPPTPPTTPTIPDGANVIEIIDTNFFIDATTNVDVFVLNDLSQAPVSATTAGQTTITLFASGDDRLDDDIVDLTAIDANTNTAEDDAFVFIGSDDFSGTAGELRADFSPLNEGTENFVVASITLEGDVDGDGQADFQLRLQDDFLAFSTVDEPLGLENLFL